MIKFFLKFFGWVIAAWVWWWLVVVKAPVLLTSGTGWSFVGFALIALSVLTPIGYFLWRFNQGAKTKEQTK